MASKKEILHAWDEKGYLDGFKENPNQAEQMKLIMRVAHKMRKAKLDEDSIASHLAQLGLGERTNFYKCLVSADICKEGQKATSEQASILASL